MTNVAVESFEQVQEPIRVVASFDGPKVRLHSFEWRGRIYQVETVNLFHIEKDAKKSLYHFAVSSEGNDYDIVFNPISLAWKLQEVVNA
ncbi:MAG: hypothetical protein WEC81_02070 [Patescibacteria group bacterium]